MEGGEPLKRKIYVAGIDREEYAKLADDLPFWLLSVTAIKRRNGLPEWLPHFMESRSILWDPGTISPNAISYGGYLTFIDAHIRPQDEYLQYDVVGDPIKTAEYLQDMRARGYNPIPVLQPGGPVSLLEEPKVAVGGLVRMSKENRRAYLDRLFYDRPLKLGRVHLLGMTEPDLLQRYEVTGGDSSSWLRNGILRGRDNIFGKYGEKEIPLVPPFSIQEGFC